MRLSGVREMTPLYYQAGVTIGRGLITNDFGQT